MQEQNAQATEQTTPEQVKVQAKNFAELRSIAESAKQENAKLTQEINMLKEQMKRQASHEVERSDEPYVDHELFRREIKKISENMDLTIEKKAEEKARLILEEEKKNNYLRENADFFEVMQQENIGKFIQEHPKIAEVVKKLPDSFERQQLVYETMKTVGSLRSKQPEAPAVNKSPLAQAFDARKAAMAYQPGGNPGGPFQSLGDFSQQGMKNSYERFKAIQKTVNL